MEPINTLDEAINIYKSHKKLTEKCINFATDYFFTAEKEKPAEAYIMIPIGTKMKQVIDGTTETEYYTTETEYYISIPKGVEIHLSLIRGSSNVLVSRGESGMIGTGNNLQCGLDCIKINDNIYNCINNRVYLSPGLRIYVWRKTYLSNNDGNLIFTIPEEWC